MLQQARLFFVALQFLTRVPSPGWVGFQAHWLNTSARYFPLVGSVVGAVAALVLWAGSMLFPPLVATGLSIIATLMLTGAFHEDGLADTCDALGGSVSRERSLEIMKDSRIGSYGAVALVAAIGLKWATLGSMLPALALPAYLLAHTVSRAAPVMLIRWLPYAGSVEHAKAKPFAQRVSAVDVAIALAWCVVVGVGIVMLRPAQWPMVAASAAMLAVGTLAASAWLNKRLGGYTGDTLGATQQVTELLILLAWLAAARWPG